MFVANSQGPVLWSWMSDMLPQDADQRTLMVGACKSLVQLAQRSAMTSHGHADGWQVSLRTMPSVCPIFLCNGDQLNHNSRTDAWANVLIYPASKAPRYTVGWPVCFGIFCSCILVVIAFRLYDVKVVR